MDESHPTLTGLIDAVHEALDRLMEAELTIHELERAATEPGARALIASTLESASCARRVLLRMHVRIESLDITEPTNPTPHLQ